MNRMNEPHDLHQQKLLDAALADSFPSSDPPSMLQKSVCVQESGTLDYNYQQFDLQAYHAALDHLSCLPMRLSLVGLDCMELDGQLVDWQDLLGQRLVIETGSLTAPTYLDNIEEMNRLHNKFRDTTFVTLYVREAHPGRGQPAHDSMAEKIAAATRLASEAGEERQIIVDSLSGELHRRMGSMPNMVYILDGKGAVCYRSAWAVPENIEAVLSGLRLSDEENDLVIKPPIPKLAGLYKAFRRAGWHAAYDFARQAPKMLRTRTKVDEESGWHH